ncbi:MAG: 2-oxoacid ferredoxin oxidoreductase, partial [Tissierellia bacterium]|nr:2-oxoacid ferredoxin oxidoreductase [Tissierellia bacterium]
MKIEYKLYDPTWCPGCGNYMIRTALKQALEELELPPYKVVISSGIGQAAKIPHYIGVNGFNGLHGRAIPPA